MTQAFAEREYRSMLINSIGGRERAEPARRGMVIVLLAALASSLTGCDPISQVDAPIALQGTGGAFVITVCATTTLESVLVQYRPAGEGEWVSFWQATGDLELVSGGRLESTTPASDWVVKSWSPPDLQPGESMTVTLETSESTISVLASVPDGGMPTTGWLKPNGEIADEAC